MRELQVEVQKAVACNQMPGTRHRSGAGRASEATIWRVAVGAGQVERARVDEAGRTVIAIDIVQAKSASLRSRRASQRVAATPVLAFGVPIATRLYVFCITTSPVAVAPSLRMLP